MRKFFKVNGFTCDLMRKEKQSNELINQNVALLSRRFCRKSRDSRYWMIIAHSNSPARHHPPFSVSGAKEIVILLRERRTKRRRHLSGHKAATFL